MTGTEGSLRLRERVALADRALDPPFGMSLAEQWVAGHLPGRRVVRSRTHTALYQGADGVSVRVSAEVGAGAADASEVTLLVRAQADGVSTAVFPHDPALPTLPTMLDPVAASRVLATAVPGSSRPAAGRHEAPWSVTVVHHPRTGACVLRYDAAMVTGSARRQVYAKVYPSAELARSAAAALGSVPGSVLRRGELTVRLPRLLGLALEEHTVFLESLGDPADSSPVGPSDAGRALRLLHDQVPTGRLPRVAHRDELSQVDAELRTARTVWPDLAELVEPHLQRAGRLLDGTSAAAPVLSHGDFTPSQLVRLPDAVGLLDLDTLRLAEPTSDLGRYLAYLELAHARRDADPGPDAASFLTAYRDAAPAGSVAPDRVEGYRTLHLTHHALRAAHRFKEHRVRRALDLLDHHTEGGRR
jgi:hypothetical protein